MQSANTPYEKTFMILVGPQQGDGSWPSSPQILDRGSSSEVYLSTGPVSGMHTSWQWLRTLPLLENRMLHQYNCMTWNRMADSTTQV